MNSTAILLVCGFYLTLPQADSVVYVNSSTLKTFSKRTLNSVRCGSK